MFTPEQLEKLDEVEKQTKYYKTAYKLQGMPQPMSEHAVQIDRVINLLGFNQDPSKKTRVVDILMSCLFSKKVVVKSKPPIPAGWAIMPNVYDTDVSAFKTLGDYTNVLEHKLLGLLDVSKKQLADIVIDHSVHGSCLERIDRFIRTCHATMEYLTEDEKIHILDAIKWYHDTQCSNFIVLRLALEAKSIYPKDFDICDYVKRIKDHNGRFVFCYIPGIEPLIKIRGKYFKLVKRDDTYRYWVESRCLRAIARRTGVKAVEWRKAVDCIDPIVSSNDLFQV